MVGGISTVNSVCANLIALSGYAFSKYNDKNVEHHGAQNYCGLNFSSCLKFSKCLDI